MFNSRIDNIERLLSKEGGNSLNSHVSVAYCSTCGGNHDSANCFHMEQVHNVNNYNWPPQNNNFSNTYNPSWKNHPNLRWRDQSNSQKPTRPLESHFLTFEANFKNICS